MDKDLKKFIFDKSQEHSRAVVGRVLKQYDILKDDISLSDKQRFDILAKINRELIYEEFRDLRNAITFYLEGRTYTKFPIYSPTKES